jgi:hypothetical protein
VLQLSGASTDASAALQQLRAQQAALDDLGSALAGLRDQVDAHVRDGELGAAAARNDTHRVGWAPGWAGPRALCCHGAAPRQRSVLALAIE